MLHQHHSSVILSISKINHISSGRSGKAGDHQFILENTIQSFLTKDKLNNGLGWMMDTGNSFIKNGHAGTFGHTGFTGTSVSVIPQDKISVILLINRQNTRLLSNGDYYNVNSIRLQVFNAVLKHRKLTAGR
jgi:serine-type D-Ala-D-Ala carboxypeptidase